MAKHNVGMIIVMVIAITIGFISMVTSAMAASDVRSAQETYDKDHKDDNLNEAHKTATLSAVLQGVVILCLFIALMLYMFRKEASAAVQSGMGGAQQWMNEQNFGAQQ